VGRSWGARALVVAGAVALGVLPLAGPTSAQAGPVSGGAEVATSAPAAPPAALKTPAKTDRKVDAVATPRLTWSTCFEDAECTTVKVPLDYDHPTGPKVALALLRVKARDQKHRIGSLFVNPGGPGGSAVQLAYSASGVLSPKVLDRFDVVGMDPRGIGFSDEVTCLSSKTQKGVLAGYAPDFPLGAEQEKAWIASDKAEGKACSKNALATSMSTAEVARDMELMRRAVGDQKLTYLGFSYGTYLGQVYANMFPDRFRALAVDGVLDPVAWAGSKSNASRPLEARLSSASGAYKALHEILVRCDRAGGSTCSFAPGDPLANLRVIAHRLRAKPLLIRDEEFGTYYTFTYSDMVGSMLDALYDPAGYTQVVDLLSSLWVLSEPPNPDARTAGTQRADAARTLTRVRTAAEGNGRPRWDPTGTSGRTSSYDNSVDAFASVTCTDSREKTKISRYPRYAAQADEKAPYFGRAWLWSSSMCAGDVFTGQDDDAYTGPFDVRTTAPVLFVGDYYDPATSYKAAVSASKRMPNSRLLSSDSFGHTAYGTSDCTTKAVDAYLLDVTLPKKGTVCVGDVQPFQPGQDDELAATVRRERASHRPLTGAFPTQR